LPVKQSRAQLLGVSLILITLALVLTGYSARSPLSVSRATRVFDWTYGPLRATFSAAFGGIASVFTDYRELVSIRSEYGELQSRTRVLEDEREHATELVQENERLRKLLNATEGQKLKRIAVRVNGYRHSGWFHTISLAGGAAVGIAPNSAVVTHDGVVGQVISVGDAFSRVLLLTDHTSSIDALVQSSRARGVVEGVSEKLLNLRFASATDAIQVGDRIITSGFDGIFPPGLLIGRVSATDSETGVLFQSVSVLPAVNVNALEEVIVLVGPTEVNPPTNIGAGPVEKKSSEALKDIKSSAVKPADNAIGGATR